MKFAIIGTNFISHNFMQAAQRIPEFQLAAVCSRNLANAEKFAQQYQAPYFCNDYQDIITNTTIDAAYIATPNAIHFEQALYFLNQGIPVLCEKPLASNLKEVDTLIATAQKNNVLLMEAIMPVTLSNFFVIKENLKNIGPIRRAFFNFGKYSSRYDSYREGIVLNAFKNELSNGSLMDIGVYSIYNVVALFGVPEKIHASAFMLESGVDGLGSVIFTYPTMEAIIMHSKITDSSLASEIQGEDGNIVINAVSIPSQITLTLRNQPSQDISVPQYKETMYYELKEFIDCVTTGKKESSLVPYQLMHDVHQTMTQIRKQINLVFPADKQ